MTAARFENHHYFSKLHETQTPTVVKRRFFKEKKNNKLTLENTNFGFEAKRTSVAYIAFNFGGGKGRIRIRIYLI